MKCVDKGSEIEPKFYFIYTMGNNLYEIKKYEEAIKYYSKALEIERYNPQPWYYKGNALYKLGKYEEAIKCYNKALENYPDFEDAKKGKEEALKALGK